ncbi:MAG: hypothetical protein PHP50_07305 [Lachnospiraceae bacterium]|nr:hypothetical protein [Lachnospiraceae bacterium]
MTTKNNKAVADVAFEIVLGTGLTLVGLLVGLGTLFRPLIKKIQYGRKIQAVCVDVESYMKAGDADADSARPVYMAVVDGKDYIYFDEIKSNVQESSVGEVFPIYVSRKDPYKFACTQSSGNVIFGLVIFLPFCCMGIVMLVLGITGLSAL